MRVSVSFFFGGWELLIFPFFLSSGGWDLLVFLFCSFGRELVRLVVSLVLKKGAREREGG